MRAPLALLAALALGGCQAPERQGSLNPLWSAPGGEGALAPHAKPPEPKVDPALPETCKHLYEPYSTHLYMDPLTGGPALCAVTICRKCGEVRHECEPRRRR